MMRSPVAHVHGLVVSIRIAASKHQPGLTHPGEIHLILTLNCRQTHHFLGGESDLSSKVQAHHSWSDGARYMSFPLLLFLLLKVSPTVARQQAILRREAVDCG